jgi:hypothetical protein
MQLRLKERPRNPFGRNRICMGKRLDGRCVPVMEMCPDLSMPLLSELKKQVPQIRMTGNLVGHQKGWTDSQIGEDGVKSPQMAHIAHRGVPWFVPASEEPFLFHVNG